MRAFNKSLVECCALPLARWPSSWTGDSEACTRWVGCAGICVQNAVLALNASVNDFLGWMLNSNA